MEFLTHIRLTYPFFPKGMYRRATESTWPPSISNILCFKGQEGSLIGCPVAIVLIELGIKVLFVIMPCACQGFESCDRVERVNSAFLGEFDEPG